jgi:two-component system NarL family sensor kinase
LIPRSRLYRLAQEGLNNINKHAQASKASIKQVASFPKLILRIEDDGKGFDVPQRPIVERGTSGMGFYGMAERSALPGGAMHIESRPGQGTHIRIEVPCKEDESGNTQDDFNC